MSRCRTKQCTENKQKLQFERMRGREKRERKGKGRKEGVKEGIKVGRKAQRSSHCLGAHSWHQL